MERFFVSSFKYKESGANLFRDKNAFIALSEAFRNMLKDPQLLPVYLAVDALDECAQGRSDLIHLISTSLTLSQKIKWLLSSRPEVDLVAELKDPGTNSLDASDSVFCGWWVFWQPRWSIAVGHNISRPLQEPYNPDRHPPLRPANAICGRCKAVSYCGRTCQVAHYKEHKAICRATASKSGSEMK